MCKKHPAKFGHRLEFGDFLQIKEFFELSDEETKKLPYQLREYLNPVRQDYRGNQILYDLDPLCLIHNPWWSASMDFDSAPVLSILFKVCGFCQRKYDKQLISQEPVEEPDLIGPDQTED
jgi:hypothetical protein